jgi:hypothetical protein
VIAGRLEEGERLAGEALALGQPHSQLALSTYGAQMFWTWWQSDRLPSLEHSIRAIAVQAPKGYHMTSAALALVCCETGQVDQAREELKQLAVAGWERLTLDQTEGATVALVASVCEALTEGSHAAALYEHFRHYAGTVVIVRPPAAACFGPADHYLGLLALAMEDVELAVGHFEVAVQLAQRMTAPPFVAASQVELARALQSTGRAADQPRIGELLRSAVATAESIGLIRVARRGRRAAEEG